MYLSFSETFKSSKETPHSRETSEASILPELDTVEA